MTGTTNPYQTWLGLNVSGRPDCYTLLGLPLYESDTGKILAAAQNAMARASIPMAPADEPIRQALVSEIQTAQNCLLDPAQKQAYDEQLRAYYSGESNSSKAEATSVQSATPVSAPVVATSAASPSDSTAEPLIQARKQSAASSAKNRARNSALTMYGILALVLVAGVGAGGYYFFVVLPAQQVAANDDQDPTLTKAKEGTNKPAPETSETEDKPDKPKGNRPTSEELANSIPGLGDPNEAMTNMDQTPGMMDAPSQPTATPQQQAELESALEKAWTAVNRQEFDNASVTLKAVQEIPKTDEGKQRFEQVDRLVQDLLAYQKALAEGKSSLQVGEELTVGSTKFKIEIINNDRVVVSFAGQNKPFDLNNLPDGFQRALAISRLTEDANTKKRIEASYLLLSPKADIEYVRQLWMQSGNDGGALATLEADQKKYAADNMVASTGGDPTGNMASAPGEDMTTGPMSSMPQSETANSESLAALLTTARKQLAERNPSAAKQALAQAATLVSAPPHQAKVESLQQLADWNVRFWEAVSKRLTKLPADEDLDVNGTITRVVESDANRLVLRVAGENRRYNLSDLPAGLAKFLAEMELPANIETKKTIGAFLMVTADDGAERASQEWSTAFMSQEEIDQLVSAYSAPLNLEADLIEQAAVPSDSDLAPAGEALAQVWNPRISSATSAKEHVQLARELQAIANSQSNGSAAQFVVFRLALAEGARGGDFELCSSIIDDWQTRFEISPGEWHLKAIQLAAGSNNSAAMHAAITRHAIEQIPLQRAAGQEKIVDAMLNIATQSATKSRDSSLIEAVQKLSAAS